VIQCYCSGFFLTTQNRFLLTNKDGNLTPRGKTIVAHTPMGKFGDQKDLIGVCIWLASNASIFVTGEVVLIDGGFNAYSGV